MLTSLFRGSTKAASLEGWRDSVLARLRDAAKKHGDILVQLEREWELLEHRTDYVAFGRRVELRTTMPGQYERRDLLALRITAAEERETIINDLWRKHDAEKAALNAVLNSIKASVTVPDSAAIHDLYVRNRALDNLRRVLHDATDDHRFAREWDVLDLLRYHWHEQQVARSRVFTHVLAPGNRPKATEPSWATQVSRVRELRFVKEEVNAR